MNIANKSGSTYISNGGGICCVIVGEGVDIVINNTGSSETRSTRPILEMPPVVDESPEAVRGVMDGYVLEADLTEEEITVIHALYEKWEAGQDYPKDKILSHNQTLYRVIQAHTSQSDWEPQNVPALFARAVPENVIPDWVQPAGRTMLIR